MLTVLIYLIILTGSNPTDPIVTSYLMSSNEQYFILRYKQSLVDSTNRHCSYCDSPVTNIKSKHCLRCNRCSLNFDHHCKFVNNCVGSINYSYFFKLILAIEVHDMFVGGVFIMYLVMKDKKLENLDCFVFFACIKSLTVVSCNGYLICLHLYLRKINLSTYDFVISRKKLKSYINPSHNMSDTNFNY